MCRFAAYLGKQPILLKSLIEEPQNSLVKQSKAAREGRHGINADGFGLAWYDRDLEPTPGVFKSVRPAWNDDNIKHIADKIQSDCFLGHVRASTVGAVSSVNCHPFYYDRYAFVHNGTIEGFKDIRRRLMGRVDDALFDEIKGQTDSEHLFILMMHALFYGKASTLEEAVLQTFKLVLAAQSLQPDDHFAQLNVVLTDGEQLMATRFVSKDHDDLSLYYSVGEAVQASTEKCLVIPGDNSGALIIASEPLTDTAKEWTPVPANHYVLADRSFDEIQIKPFTFN